MLIVPQEYGTTKQEAVGLSMKLLDAGTARAAALHQSGLDLGTVLGNRVLTAAGHAEKRHIEFELPKDMSYQAGDYLAMWVCQAYMIQHRANELLSLPTNPDASVQRVLARFGISREQEVHTTLSIVRCRSDQQCSDRSFRR
jgi:cytochrome P450/NADPH-cytochrome P450 reductase